MPLKELFASNDSSILETYELRRVMEKITLRYTADFWKEQRHNYGRVDYRGNAIYPSEAFLRAIEGTTSDELYVLSFVADAFEDWMDYIRKLTNLGKIQPRGSVIFPAEPIKSWKSFNDFYHQHCLGLLTVFLETEGAKFETKSKIVDFEDFVCQFVSFMKTLDGKLPLLKSSVVLSSTYDPLFTGLVLEFVQNPMDDDKFVDDWLRDPNFLHYRDSLKRFGFKYDKNAPWRIVADIKSAPMQEYLKNSRDDVLDIIGDFVVVGFDTTQVFEEYFYKAYEVDVLNMKEYLRQFYNQFVENNLNYKNDLLTDNFKVRDKISKAQMDEGFSDQFWIEVYFDIKFADCNINPTAKDRQILMTSHSFEKKVEKINSTIKTYLYLR